MDEPEHELVMPDVVTTDTGGPYDPESYGAGLIVGWVMGDLERGDRDDRDHYVLEPLLPQLDLIAMQYGYRMAVAPCEVNPGRVWAHFEKAPQTPPQ